MGHCPVAGLPGRRRLRRCGRRGQERHGRGRLAAPVLIAPVVEALLAAGPADRRAAAELVEGASEASSPWLLYARGPVTIDGDDLDAVVALLTMAASQFETAGYALDEIRVLPASARALTLGGRETEAQVASARAASLADDCGALVLARQAALKRSPR